MINIRQLIAASLVSTGFAGTAHADCAINPNAGNGVFPDDEVICSGVDPDGLTIDLSSINGRDDNTLRVRDGATVVGPLDISNGNSINVGRNTEIGSATLTVPAITLRDVDGISNILFGDINSGTDTLVFEGVGGTVSTTFESITAGPNHTAVLFDTPNVFEPGFVFERFTNLGEISGGTGVDALVRRDARIENQNLIEGTSLDAVVIGPGSDLINNQNFLTDVDRPLIVGRSSGVNAFGGGHLIENDGEIRSLGANSAAITITDGTIINNDLSFLSLVDAPGLITSTAPGGTAIRLTGLGTGTVRVENEADIYGEGTAIDGTIDFFSDVALDYLGTEDSRLLSNGGNTLALGRLSDRVTLLDESEIDGESLLGGGDDLFAVDDLLDLAFGGFGGLPGVALVDGQGGTDRLDFLGNSFAELDIQANGYGFSVNTIFDPVAGISDQLWFRGFETFRFAGDERAFSLSEVLDGTPGLAPVPLPASGWLLLVGLGGLLLRRRAT